VAASAIFRFDLQHRLFQQSDRVHQPVAILARLMKRSTTPAP
jgi:hypothetical protein